jgi:hypothetical protein
LIHKLASIIIVSNLQFVGWLDHILQYIFDFFKLDCIYKRSVHVGFYPTSSMKVFRFTLLAAFIICLTSFAAPTDATGVSVNLVKRSPGKSHWTRCFVLMHYRASSTSQAASPM